MSKAWERGSTRAWRKARALTFHARGRACTLQLPGCTGWAGQVHHTRGRAATGDDLRYLEPACAECNRAAGDPAARPTADPRPRPRTEW